MRKTIFQSEFGANPAPYMRIVPCPLGRVPIMINRSSKDGAMYWDDPVDKVAASEVDLRFICYFDWDPEKSMYM